LSTIQIVSRTFWSMP